MATGDGPGEWGPRGRRPVRGEWGTPVPMTGSDINPAVVEQLFDQRPERSHA
jgi:hypothetical protein